MIWAILYSLGKRKMMACQVSRPKAGCLLKKFLGAGKNTPAFATLTIGKDFRFFTVIFSF
jgi:hypothetical protein